MKAADRQLPQGDEIFFDHLAHFVPDIEAASRALTRVGFAPTPVSIQTAPDASGQPQPTGTGNITAMLRRGYLEFLFKTADTPLGVQFDAALARYPGLHLAAFSVADAGAARERLQAAGFPVEPLVEMSRPVASIDGPATAAFTIARVAPGTMPEGRVQILTHRTEAAVWQPRWLGHPNGARGLIDLVIAEADVDEAARRFARFTGRPAQANAAGRCIRLDRGAIQLVSAQAFARQLPGIAIPGLPFIGAYAVAVESVAATAALLRAAGHPQQRCGPVLVVPFPDALGRGAWMFAERVAELPWRR